MEPPMGQPAEVYFKRASERSVASQKRHKYNACEPQNHVDSAIVANMPHLEKSRPMRRKIAHSRGECSRPRTENMANDCDNGESPTLSPSIVQPAASAL